uniref:PRL2-21 n=1 Tax=Streptomyces sp. 44414 TaxID=364103 RepID=Q2LET1_9ACTN|nr:hypothetical protein [Streptomyces sp. 44414]ABC67384.1 pRL2-21 [Streptomyces sp. 44414]
MSPEPEEKEPGVSVLEDAYRRWQAMPPVSLTMQRKDLFLVLMAIQTANRFPGTSPQIARLMESVGRQIQDAVVDDPELYTLAETGWDPAHDVDQAPATD